MVTKDYYRMSSYVFLSLCSSLDVFARFTPFLREKNLRLRFVFHLKMASAYIPFDEVNAAMFLGKFFPMFRMKVKKIFQTTMRVRVWMILMRKTTSLQAILGIRPLRVIGTACVFLFVCLSTRFKCLE